METSSITGRCGCGENSLVVDGPIRKVVNCHCNLCRKMNGTAFSTYAVVLEREFTFEGKSSLALQVNDNITKTICVQCGSALFNKNPVYQGLVMIYLGALDEAQSITPEANIYAESQLPWLTEINTLLTFDQALTK